MIFGRLCTGEIMDRKYCYVCKQSKNRDDVCKLMEEGPSGLY